MISKLTHHSAKVDFVITCMIWALILHLFFLSPLQSHVDNYGIDWDGPTATDYQGTTVVEIPETLMLLTEANHSELKRTIDPMRESQHQGVDIYMDTVNFINEH